MAIINGDANDNFLMGDVNGVAEADIIKGFGGTDSLFGFSGDDQLFGGGGADSLGGGRGVDSLFGGSGGDVLAGGLGADTLDGGDGIDTASYVGSTGGVIVNLATGFALGGDADGDTLLDIENIAGTGFDDFLVGDDNANALTGLGGIDVLQGQGGKDSLDGGAGADEIDGGSDNDEILGGEGGDTVIGGAGSDSLDGGAGIDTVSYAGSSAGVIASLASGQASVGDDLDAIVHFENLTGSGFDDLLTGDERGNVLKGLDGIDFLRGDGGADVLVGGEGADVLTGGTGVDTFDFNGLWESTRSTSDIIDDFDLTQDVIDLSTIDADITTGKNEAFTFIGANGFSGTAGELRFEFTNGDTHVQVDVDGNGRADMEITLAEKFTLTAGDFDL